MPKNLLWLISGAVKTGVVFTPVTDLIHTVTGVVTAMQLYIHNLPIKTSSDLIPRSTKIIPDNMDKNNNKQYLKNSR